jgi:hypothetical protein
MIKMVKNDFKAAGIGASQSIAEAKNNEMLMWL